MLTIHEPVRETPVCYDCDVFVIGGSCTGVFAAFAAARLGAKVGLVESLGYFGGTATASLVCVWHSRYYERGEREIIAGLTLELMERLMRRNGAVDKGHHLHMQYIFSPYEMAIELDRMVEEANVRPFLHTRFVGCTQDNIATAKAVIIEDKTGRRAIRARMFIDASGDADLVYRMGLETRKIETLPPPTTCAIVQGLGHLHHPTSDFNLAEEVFDPKHDEALQPGFMWLAPIPGDDMLMIAGTRVRGANCSDADDLTRAESEGRQQVSRTLSIARKQPGGEHVRLQSLPARIGIRETRHAVCLTERELLGGKRFPDAIMNGSYRVDIHRTDGGGTILRYLNGREEHTTTEGKKTEVRWRAETTDTPTFYQLPYRSLVPKDAQTY